MVLQPGLEMMGDPVTENETYLLAVRVEEGYDNGMLPYGGGSSYQFWLACSFIDYVTSIEQGKCKVGLMEMMVNSLSAT